MTLVGRRRSSARCVGVNDVCPSVACRDGLVRPARSLLGAGPGVVRHLVPRGHAAAGPGLAGHRLGRAHADPGPHRLGQDARRVPLGARPARHRAAARRQGAAHPAPLHLAAAGARGRRREEPAGAAAGHRPRGRAPRRAVPPADVGMRTGDTPADERRALLRNPPDLLITTPESLYLMLTSAARETPARRRGRDHRRDPRPRRHQARAPTWRSPSSGSTPSPTGRVQRIGLSATQRPLDEIARFLGGSRRRRPATRPARSPSSTPACASRSTSRSSSRSRTWARSARSSTSRSSGPASAGRAAPLDLAVDAPPAARAGRGAPLDDHLRQRPPPGRAAGHPAQRAGTSTGESRAAEADGHAAERRAASWSRPTTARCRRERRLQIEDELKRGRAQGPGRHLSLELGIDMGAVDLVIQVESPGAVSPGPAAHRPGRPPGGRAEPGQALPQAPRRPRRGGGRRRPHARGAHRAHPLPPQPARRAGPADRGHGARSTTGRSTTSPPWSVASANFAELSDEVLANVLDLLAGRYPSEEFAELRPRIVWDRVDGVVRGRAGAQRLAVTSGGTIPDRGLFGVFLPDGTRVGELDEEMVYESRPGETFLLGRHHLAHRGHHPRAGRRHARRRASRARCRSGTATARAARSSWAGRSASSCATIRADAAGRGARARCSDRQRPRRARRQQPARLPRRAGRGHGGVVPDDRTIVVERFRDEIGDWRVCILTPFGAQVHAPWAMALQARLAERWGVDVELHVERRRHRPAPARGDRRAPPRRAARSTPTRSTSSSSPSCPTPRCSPARFRECAARALLLPRRRPDRRTPLWQQRQRAADLLAVAAKLPRLPDPARGHPRVPQRRVRPAGAARGPHRPAGPARSASSPVDTPAGLAVRPVAAVRLDRRLHVRGRRAAGRAPGRRAGARPRPAARPARRRGAARAARPGGARPTSSSSCSAWPTAAGPATPTRSTTCSALLGPLTPWEVDARADTAAADARRLGRARGSTRWSRERRAIAVQRRRRGALRRGRGRRPPARRARRGAARRAARGVHRPGARAAASTWSPASPAPTARSSPRQVAAPLGVGADRVLPVLERARGRRPHRAGRVPARRHRARVVRRRRAAPAPPPLARRAAPRGRAGRRRRPRPVPARVAGRRRRPAAGSTRWSRRSARSRALALPASVLEADVLAGPGRRLPPGRPRRALHRGRGGVGRRRAARRRRRPGPAALPRPGRPAGRPARRRAAGRGRSPSRSPPPLHDAPRRAGRLVLARPGRRGAARPASPTTTPTVLDALWDLVWAGRGHQRLAGPAAGHGGVGRPPQGRGRRPRRPPGRARPHRRPPPEPRRPSVGSLSRLGPPAAAGRWSLVAPAARAPAHRHRGRPRQRPAAARALRRAHPRGGAGRGHRGRVRRRLPGAQGARGAGPGPARLLRRRPRAPPSSPCPAPSTGSGPSASPTRSDDRAPVVLAATDPAQPYGAALPWPESDRPARPGRRRARGAGRGEPVAYLERGGRSLVVLPRRRAPSRAGPTRSPGWSRTAGSARSRSPASTASRRPSHRTPRPCVPLASATATGASCSAAVTAPMQRAEVGLRCPRATPSTAPPSGWRRRSSAGSPVRFEAHRACPAAGRSRASLVTEVEAQGKHLLVHFDDGWTLQTHMRMTGSWHLYRPGERWRKPRPSGAGRGRGRPRRRIGSDPRRLGGGLLLGPGGRAGARAPARGHLGPDLCTADADLDEAVRRMDSLDPSTPLGRRPARPAHLLRRRQRLQERGAVRPRPASPHADRLRSTPVSAGRWSRPRRASCGRTSPRPPHHRGRAARHPRGLRAPGRAVPPLRHPDRVGPHRRPGPRHLLVPRCQVEPTPTRH